MKIRSINELEDVLAKEYSWRRKELTNLRNLASTSSSPMKNTLLRCGVALLYAHWEGFVKRISIAYCDYINFQGLKYSEVQRNFHVCALISRFKGQYPPSNFKTCISIVTHPFYSTDEKLSIDSKKYIDTKSNLNSDVLREIIAKVGLDYSHFELKANLIDESFLGLRNAISHGEWREVEEEEFTNLYLEVTALIDTYKNLISNAASTKHYLSSQVGGI